MKTIIDLHIHSKYSRATSKNFDLKEIVKWSEIKGVDITSCADFTHPAWFKELKNNLVEDSNSGLYKLKDSKTNVRFIISTEVACIYRQGGKTRRIHLCLLAPSLEVAEKINKSLENRGAKLAADGRPILGMSAKDVLNILLEVDERCMMIPAHAWTPWFAVFGSKSGFSSLKECFEDLTPHIKAVETGLSSDPSMNWLLSELDNITLISNSDAHSGPNIGREANVFDLKEKSYDHIVDIISKKDKKRFLYTIEFYPEEGMYYYDGHRSCNFSCSPLERIEKYKNICPKCKKKLTVGVLSQVHELADLKEKDVNMKKHIGYKSIIPLPNIIADYYGFGRGSKKVNNLYMDIIQKGGNEFNVLLELKKEELNKIMPEILVKAILDMRDNNAKLIPGFDGQYGSISLFSEKDRKNIDYTHQSLFNK